MAHVSEIDSGTADAIKNTLVFVRKSGRDAVIIGANVSDDPLVIFCHILKI